MCGVTFFLESKKLNQFCWLWSSLYLSGKFWFPAQNTGVKNIHRKPKGFFLLANASTRMRTGNKDGERERPSPIV
jgi:hypothetical protein